MKSDDVGSWRLPELIPGPEQYQAGGKHILNKLDSIGKKEHPAEAEDNQEGILDVTYPVEVLSCASVTAFVWKVIIAGNRK